MTDDMVLKITCESAGKKYIDVSNNKLQNMYSGELSIFMCCNVRHLRPPREPRRSAEGVSRSFDQSVGLVAGGFR